MSDRDYDRELVANLQGIESDFWKYFRAWLEKKIHDVNADLRSKEGTARDWNAGFVSALEMILKHPEEQVNGLRQFLKSRQDSGGNGSDRLAT